MKHNKVFHSTRLRLAGLYTGTMGIILTLCGIVFYEAMVHSHLAELNHRIESVTGTLHDALEASLQEPGELDPIVQRFLPGLCIAQTECAQQSSSASHYLGVFQQDGYHIRFLDLSGRLLASDGQVPIDLPAQLGTEPWQTLEASDGNRYRQFSLILKTADQAPWGYMQVGRSLHEVEGHMVWVRWILLVGLPSAMMLVVVASWWLAEQAMQPVYKSYRQMQQFTADAAHELRTPLAAIQANLESTLTPDAADAEAWDTLRIVERQNARLSKLVQDLLLLSRMDLQGLPAKHQLCNLNDLVNDLLEEFAALAIAADVSLAIDRQQNNPITVIGNEQQLYRLVANLIINAIQYTPGGGEVIIRLAQEDHYAQIQVQDLPEKVEQKLYCNLTKEQASLYDAIVKDVEKQLQSAEGIQRKGLILATLMKLKQICNHPMQFLQDGSEFLPERSHKLERLTEMIQEAIDEGESLLVFTQFTEIGEALEAHLKQSRYSTFYLHGGTPRPKRERMITEFQDPDTEPSIFILSLKAGGVGITLTKANHVFHFDRWWNPAVEDQATDRAFRIGQKKNVFVHKFIALGTLEERIDEMIEDKKKLAGAIVGSDESWLTELDNESFKKLIALNRSSVID